MRQFGLIGKELSHSFSENYFKNKFQQEKIHNARYDLFPLTEIEKFKELITLHSFTGLNVTIPYKTIVLQYVNEIDKAAKEIGATNCLHFTLQKITAYNTDYIAFTQSIHPLLETHHKSALILGNGGASKAIAYSLKLLGIEYEIIARNPEKNQILWDKNIDHLIDNHHIIINCTSIGTFPNIHECPEINYKKITSKHLIYDLVYNPAETQFIKQAKNAGAKTKNGLQMLHLQAEESWRIWNKKEE